MKGNNELPKFSNNELPSYKRLHVIAEWYKQVNMFKQTWNLKDLIFFNQRMMWNVLISKWHEKKICGKTWKSKHYIL